MQALLSDLAGEPDFCAELLEAVWDVQSGRTDEWSMNYNAYGVEVRSGGAHVMFLGDSCSVPLALLEAAVARRVGL